MSNEKGAGGGATERKPRKPNRVRLPGFVSEEAEVKLGDLVKRATATVGFRPCEGCERRAEALNRWMVFSGRRSG